MFSETANGASWRDRALERSLEAARARSVERLERLVDAARVLANETGRAAFTVTQVTAQAGLSLKSFYRCFAGKDDLLVALIEEDSRLGAALLGEMMEQHADPVARVRAYVMGVFEMLTHPGAIGYAGVLVREHRRLSEERPDELRRALAPMIAGLEAEIAAAAAAGSCGSRDAARDAELVFALVLEGIHDVALGRAEPLEQATHLWSFCWAGLSRTSATTGDEQR
ncbi:MAG: TetR/AcrR family transcriptional regulator [Acidimicrobiia bacterium]